MLKYFDNFILSNPVLLSNIILSLNNYRSVKDFVLPIEIGARYRFQHSARENIERFQNNRLQEIVDYAYKTCSYWKNEFGSKKINFSAKSKFSDLSIVKKANIRDSKEMFISETVNSFYKMATSGSSGVPLEFYIDQSIFVRRAFALHYALKQYGLDTHLNILRLSYQDFPWRNYQGRYFDVSLLSRHGAGDIRKFLNIYKPAILYGTVSHILAFAEFIEKNSCDWRFEGIITRSEHLTDAVRAYFESVFGGKAYNIYAAREFGPIAQECVMQKGHHVNEDIVFLEIVDDDGNIVPEGTEGNILITSLYNKSMPFIRYEIGDRGGFVVEKCGCGLQTKRIMLVGRNCDFVYLPSGRKLPISDLFSPLSIVGVVRAFQFIQQSFNELIIRVATGGNENWSNVSQTIKLRVYKTANLASEANFVLRVEKVDEIPLLPNGKRKLFVSCINSSNSTIYDGNIFV